MTKVWYIIMCHSGSQSTKPVIQWGGWCVESTYCSWDYCWSYYFGWQKPNKSSKNGLYAGTTSIELARCVRTCETWAVAAEIHSPLLIRCARRRSLHSCHCHLLGSDICQRCSKAKSVKLGSPVSVFHCSVVFAKDHLKTDGHHLWLWLWLVVFTSKIIIPRECSHSETHLPLPVFC